MGRSMGCRSKVLVLRITEEKEAGRSSPVTFFKDSVGIQQAEQNGIKETSHLI